MILRKLSSRVAAASLVLLASLSTSCTTLDDTNSGYIAGPVSVNMTTTDAAGTGQSVLYRSLDGRHRGGVSYVPSPLTGNLMAEIKEGDLRGSTFLKRLPEGEYAFTGNTTAHASGGPMVLVTSQDREMGGGRFTVRRGKVTYVGAWEVTPVVGSNLLGMDRMVDATFSVRDREERDMALIAKKRGGALPVADRQSDIKTQG